MAEYYNKRENSSDIVNAQSISLQMPHFEEQGTHSNKNNDTYK